MSYERTVFVNCPFDPPYLPLRDALLFTLADCGFIPRMALDRRDGSETRIAKLTEMIGQCALAVHDLSRTAADADSGLPRFNMPLEFGMFLGAKLYGDANQRAKACLVFDSEPYRYQKYISDVAGQDIASHGNDPRRLVCEVRDWLASNATRDLPGGAYVWSRYQTFVAELPAACAAKKHAREALTYRDYMNHVDRFRVLRKETLRSERGKAFTDPDQRRIKETLRALSPDGNAFAIYTRGGDGSTYMQTFCFGENAFDLEYQEGALENHFTVAVESVTRDEIIAAFQRYAVGDDSWKAQWKWQRMEL